jgi:hypothetical protein
MATLLFFGTVLAVIVLLVRLVVKGVQRKPVLPTVKYIAIILISYALIWMIFSVKATNEVVPFSTDICFDDWCATVTKVEMADSLGSVHADGRFVILHIKMSNMALGIAQKPSEPRVHIMDDRGNSWGVSISGRQKLVELQGRQIPLDQRLELHESLETQLVFDIPQKAVGLKVLIEEGPAVTRLLIPEDKRVFQIQQ